MNQVILLSDNTFFGTTGVSRYMGPYALANGLETHGIKTVVIDYLHRIQDFYSFFESFLTSETLIVGVSTTFLCEPLSKETLNSKTFSWITASSYLKTPPMAENPIVFDRWLKKIREIINKKSPNAKIIVGGAKVQSLFNYGAELFTDIDYVAWGGVDHVMHLMYEDLKRTGQIKHFMHNDRKIIDTISEYKQIKGCPTMKWQSGWAIQDNEALPIEISRGCKFDCKFCHYEKKESFIKDIEILRTEFISNYEKFGTQFYHFCDDCFNDHPNKVKAVCEMILSLPFSIEWVSYARVDVAVRFPETADLMVKSGASGLFWGLESFNPIAAKKAGKGTPPEHVKAFLKDFYSKYRDQCTSLGSFIVGLPGETESSQRETIQWVCEEEALHFINVGPLRISPYSEVFDKKILDYADYARNPEKYGFEQVSFTDKFAQSMSENWKHQTMCFSEALNLTTEFLEKWRSSSPRRRGLIPSMWSYPHLRSLGYSKAEVFDMHFDESKTQMFLQDISTRFTNRTKNYFSDLKRLNNYGL